MLTKALRIIVADTRLCRRIQIEKSLNRAGYYRILPIQSGEELRLLSNRCGIVFDALIANKRLVLEAESDPTAFLRTADNIHHALFYGSQLIDMTALSSTASRTFVTQAINIPSDELIEAFMLSVDTPSSSKCFNDLGRARDAENISYQGQALRNNDSRPFAPGTHL